MCLKLELHRFSTTLDMKGLVPVWALCMCSQRAPVIIKLYIIIKNAFTRHFLGNLNLRFYRKKIKKWGLKNKYFPTETQGH